MTEDETLLWQALDRAIQCRPIDGESLRDLFDTIVAIMGEIVDGSKNT